MNERTNKEGACTQPGGGVKETIEEGQGIKHGTLMTSGGRHRQIIAWIAVDVEQSSLASPLLTWDTCMGPPPVRHVPGVRAIHGSYAVGVRAANRQASGRRQPVWLVLVHRLAGLSDVDRCHSVSLLLGFDILPGARCAVQWPLPAHIDNNIFTVFTCLLPVVLTFIFLFS
jgi:hypothetical protein